MNSIKECRLCKSCNINIVISFGQVALANSYPESNQENEDLFPLTVVKCKDCDHIQLRETIDPKKLFSNYSYASSDSPRLVKHFKEFAATVTKKLNIQRDERFSILEIGSNDGILLKELLNLGYKNLFGVEPATNIAEKSIQLGAKIINDFFNLDTAKHISKKYSKINLICANNVFAHVSELDSMVEGICELLTNDGVFVFENAYLLDTIKGLYFDQVYHEHLQYYGIKPLIKYFAKYELEIFDIERVSTQGGSFRIYVKKKANNIHKINESVKEFVSKEEEFELYENKTFDLFKEKIENLSNQVNEFIKTANKEGKTISCYGCPAKFALFSKQFNLNSENIKYVVDDSPLKQGKFSPGEKIPIVNRNYFYKNQTDYCIISAWNMANSIIESNKNYSGKFIIPMPIFKIV